MKVISTERIPIKSWCENPEEGALNQAKNLANFRFSYHHIALMPDTHQGYGMPIGGVVATMGVISPNMVGVDIGCGMLCVKTSLTKEFAENKDSIKKILSEIRDRIPLGFDHHKVAQEHDQVPLLISKEMTPICAANSGSILFQIGTLGGGNHFIEIQLGNDGYIYFMIHSGSRNLGKQVADHYNSLAKSFNERDQVGVPKSFDLAFFDADSEYGQRYLAEMTYCLNFAFMNRQLMSERIKESFKKVVHKVDFMNEINIHHNYAALENHFGESVWVHRKGATLATTAQLGLIPGSQGSKSYIVRGKGNIESFQSCSHGAGRRMGRGEARKTLSLTDEIKKLEDKGIIHAIRNQKDLDEAAGAYKPIKVVMEEQKDLIDIVTELEPLAVIKG